MFKIDNNIVESQVEAKAQHRHTNYHAMIRTTSKVDFDTYFQVSWWSIANKQVISRNDCNPWLLYWILIVVLPHHFAWPDDANMSVTTTRKRHVKKDVKNRDRFAISFVVEFFASKVLKNKTQLWWALCVWISFFPQSKGSLAKQVSLHDETGYEIFITHLSLWLHVLSQGMKRVCSCLVKQTISPNSSVILALIANFLYMTRTVILVSPFGYHVG